MATHQVNLVEAPASAASQRKRVIIVDAMIADSPYQVSSSALSPRMGVGAGLVAALFMLVVMQLIAPITGCSVEDALLNLGGLVMSSMTSLNSSGLQRWCGLTLHLAMGALFGLLYSVSQQNAERYLLIAVGLFYGCLLWIGGRLFGACVGEPVRTMLRSWSWLAGSLSYGLCLAFAAICRQGNSSGRVSAQPLD